MQTLFWIMVKDLACCSIRRINSVLLLGYTLRRRIVAYKERGK
jgi:hypothetical protein